MFTTDKVHNLESGKIIISITNSFLEASFISNGSAEKKVLVNENICYFDSVTLADRRSICVAYITDKNQLVLTIFRYEKNEFYTDKTVSFIFDGATSVTCPIIALNSKDIAVSFVLRSSKYECCFIPSVFSDNPLRETVCRLSFPFTLHFLSVSPPCFFLSAENKLFTVQKSTSGKYTPVICICSFPSQIESVFFYPPKSPHQTLISCFDGIYLDRKKIIPYGIFPHPGDNHNQILFSHNNSVMSYEDGNISVTNTEFHLCRTDTFPYICFDNHFLISRNEATANNYNSEHSSNFDAAVSLLNQCIYTLESIRSLLTP